MICHQTILTRKLIQLQIKNKIFYDRNCFVIDWSLSKIKKGKEKEKKARLKILNFMS